jgi:hypothetical protein
LGLLSRRRSAFEQMENEIAGLTSRRTVLADRLSRADVDIERALCDRRRQLVETDSDESNVESTQVGQLREARAGFADAVGALDGKIAEAVARLDAARDRAMREAAAKELAAAVEGLTRVHDELAAVAAKVAPAISAVLAKLPAPHLVAPERVKAFADGIVEALQVVAREGQSHASRLISGAAQICEPVAQQPVTQPPPAIERAPIFLLGRSRWEENGETITSGPHCTVSPPAPIARAAIEFGHAIEAGSDLAVTLQMRQPPSYANYAPADCLDISQPKPLTKPLGSPTAAPVLIHSEFDRGRGGFASVMRNPR